MIARVLVVVAICVIRCALSTPVLAQALDPPTATVAAQQATIDDPGHAPIPIAIWSPPSGSGSLVVISHGTGGNLNSHIDTARALAHSGFVVVALTHPGDNFRDLSAVGKPDWFVDRTRQVSRAIDFMFTRWEGRTRLIPDRVGMFGFSAGATTALISIGGVPDLERVPVHCAKQPEFVCSLMAPTSVSGGPPPQWTHDRRIAAVVVVAPGLGFAFAPSGLATVSVPVQLWSGDADRAVPFETNTAIVRELLPQAPEFHDVPGAVHFSFLAPCGTNTPSELCRDGAGFDRLAFHRELNSSVVRFFREHLAERVQAGQR